MRPFGWLFQGVGLLVESPNGPLMMQQTRLTRYLFPPLVPLVSFCLSTSIHISLGHFYHFKISQLSYYITTSTCSSSPFLRRTPNSF